MVLMISNVVLEKIPRICGVIGSTSNDSSNGSVSVSNRNSRCLPMAQWPCLGEINSRDSLTPIPISPASRCEVVMIYPERLRWNIIIPRIFVFENLLLFEVSLSLSEASVFFRLVKYFSETRKDEVNCIVLRLEIADTIG